MNPIDYLSKIVDPTISEYEAARSDFRRCLLACMTLIHTYDYINEYNKTEFSTAERFFADLDKRCIGAFDLYRFVIAGKHTFHKNSGITIDKIQSRPAANWNYFEFDRSHFDDEIGTVEIEIEAIQIRIDAYNS